MPRDRYEQPPADDIELPPDIERQNLEAMREAAGEDWETAFPWHAKRLRELSR